MQRATAGAQHRVIQACITAQILRIGEQHHGEPALREARMDLPRDHHPVAAVVALAAQHQDALRLQRGKPFGQKFHHAKAGILHQDDAGDAHFDGAPIDLAHLGRGENFHMRLTTTIVMSSCNSEEPVQTFTDSMVRAISSEESACAYLDIRSFNRSSPNISP